MIRVAFTSCSDPMDDPEQGVWNLIAAQKPDHLVLLGDQIYMDYGNFLVHSNNPRLGKPAEMTNADFAAAMHERYLRQWGIMQASRLIELKALRIHGIWDDHDFAWNNSYGDSGSNRSGEPASKRDPVSRDKQAISRRLMRDFFAALQSASPSYPLNPFIGNAVPPAEDLTLPMYCACPPGSASIPLGQGVKLLLTDGRTFRTRTNMDAATVFGAQQWDWLANELNAVDVILLACGSTLDHGGTPLDLYGDYEKLVTLSQKKDAKLLCLTGDVHKIDWRNKHGGRIFEAVASGAARTKFGTSGAYGLAEISDTDVSIRLYENSLDPTSRHSIGRDTWQEH